MLNPPLSYCANIFPEKKKVKPVSSATIRNERRLPVFNPSSSSSVTIITPLAPASSLLVISQQNLQMTLIVSDNTYNLFRDCAAPGLKNGNSSFSVWRQNPPQTLGLLVNRDDPTAVGELPEVNTVLMNF